MKVVHTSALHLGGRFPNYERDAERIRTADVFAAFEQVVEHVIREKVQLLLIAGDLFNRLHPDRETISFALSRFGEIHGRVPDAHVVICPGEEEAIAKSGGQIDCILSVFQHLPYVHVLGVGGKVDTAELKWGKLAVNVASCGFDRFLDPDFRDTEIPEVKDSFGIFLLHCYSRKRGAVESDDSLLKENVFAPLFSRGYRYFALGHSSRYRDLSAGDYGAVFPGSLERLDIESDRDKKYFVQFEVKSHDSPAEHKAIAARVRPVEYVSLSCVPDEKDLASLVSPVAGAGNKEAVLYIVLEGQIGFEAFKEFHNGELIPQLKEKYAIVHIDNRLTLVDEREGYQFYPLHVGSPEDEFRRYMEKEIAQAAPGSQEQAFLWELLEMGLREIGETL